jgi:hypothetical protein
VSFPNGNFVGFPTAGGSSDTSAAIVVALNGASGVEQADFNIAFTDPTLGTSSPMNVTYSKMVNYDEVPGASTTETFEASVSPWTVSGSTPVFPDIQTWHFTEISPLQHVANGPDNNGQTSDTTGNGTENMLTSPSMHVGSGSFSVSFQHRFNFENGSFDGGVVEISTDGGNSWTDIGTSAYNGTIALGGLNPIEGRKAFVNKSANWPTMVAVTLNLGTTYANQDVKIRFHVGADLSTGMPGWDIDNVSVTGTTTNPFTAIVPSNPACGTGVTLASSQNPSAYGQSITLQANVSGGLSTPTGTVTFNDGASAIGSSPLDGGGQASISTAALSGGSHNLTAAYSGDGSHGASTSAILVQQVNAADQTVTLDPIPNHFITDAPFTVHAVASSGLPVTYSIASGPATISGNTVTLTGTTGTVVVQASQAGDGNYNPASATQSFSVSTASASLSFVASTVNTGSGYRVTLTVKNPGNVTLNNVTVTGATLGSAAGTPLPQAVGTIAPNGGTATITLNFPSSAGNPNTAVIGKFTASTSSGTFTNSLKMVLPAATPQ